MCHFTNFVICLIVAYVIYQLLTVEGFTSSGLSMSNPYCDRLVSTYYHPSKIEDRERNVRRMCGIERRGLIEDSRGNYFTANNHLI